MNISAPKRAVRSYTQRLVGTPQQVFPLLCPVREAEWIDGWNPLAVHTASGVAERDCVFITAAEPANAIWYVTRHEAAHGFVEMIKIVPDVTATRLTIQLRATATGCDAHVTYGHTSLGPEGDAFVDAFTEPYYADFMLAWETRLNHFLRHGTKLVSD